MTTLRTRGQSTPAQQQGTRAKRTNKHRLQSDPTNPRNTDKTLGELQPEHLSGIDESTPRMRRDRLSVEPAHIKAKPAFWDATAITALIVSLVLGGISGVPLGYFIYSMTQ